EDDLRALAELLASRSDEQLFGQTEFQLRGLAHRLGAKALQTAAQQRKRGSRGSSMTCPHCQQAARFKGYRPKGLLTVLGPVTVERAYYHCAHCHRGTAPATSPLASTKPT